MSAFTNKLHRQISKVLHRYADFRVGATDNEKRCYKHSDTVLLSFDDYGSKEEVESILNILKDNTVKAMFFLQGDWAIEHPALVEKIKQAGHEVGNHTFSHSPLLGLNEQAIANEVTRGLPGPWFRPPKGQYNKKIRQTLHQLGYVICYWTIDSRDWTGRSAALMKENILNELHSGAVILMHINGKHTAELLPDLINEIRQAGYRLTSPDEKWHP